MSGRFVDRLRFRRESQLTVISRTGEDRRVVFRTSEHIEAPNWTSDGRALICNVAGKLCRIPLHDGAIAESIRIEGATSITNDHLLSADGSTVYFTANGAVFAAPLAGGRARQLSPEVIGGTTPQYYVHGLSPDGATLCCVQIAPDNAQSHGICTIPAIGGAATMLLQLGVPVDGPEYSADGQWIWFNGEINARRSGHSQLFRMRIDGSAVEQVTDDERVNWFPHPSPDGESVVYLSYVTGTQGHPADQQVEIRVIASDLSREPIVIPVSGGQGSINSRSWSPLGNFFAFVQYVSVPRW